MHYSTYERFTAIIIIYFDCIYQKHYGTFKGYIQKFFCIIFILCRLVPFFLGLVYRKLNQKIPIGSKDMGLYVNDSTLFDVRVVSLGKKLKLKIVQLNGHKKF